MRYWSKRSFQMSTINEIKAQKISFHLTLFVQFLPPSNSYFNMQICPPLSYFNITQKLKKCFALMYPDFKLNLIAHIFRKFVVCRTTKSDVIFAFVRGTLGVSYSFEHNACLSVRVFYSLHCIFIIDASL